MPVKINLTKLARLPNHKLAPAVREQIAEQLLTMGMQQCDWWTASEFGQILRRDDSCPDTPQCEKPTMTKKVFPARTTTVHIKCSPEMLARLRERARDNVRTLSSECYWRLVESIEQEEIRLNET
jgi:Arc-like DNA binding domain